MPIEDDLKANVADHIHSVFSVSASLVPGGSELFNTVFTKPLEIRRNDWIIQMEKRLRKLETTRLNIESLQHNEDFISTVIYATSIASYTNSKTKRQALLNATTNTALLPNIDITKKMIFLRYIEQFTEWHLKTLYYFENPSERFREKGISKTSGDPFCSKLQHYFSQCHYGSIPSDEIMRIILKDLFDSGFINSEPTIWNKSMSENEALESRITALGEEFFNFIHNIE